MDSILSLIIGLVLGILFVLWDHKKGQAWYKRWYDLSHKDPLHPSIDDTFIRNQPFSKRVVPAIIITGVFMYITWWLGNLNPLITFLQGGIALVAVIIGFYVGPFIANKLPKGLKKANETLRKIDAIEADIKEVKPINVETPKPERDEIKSPPKKDDKDEDWRKGIKDFLDK